MALVVAEPAGDVDGVNRVFTVAAYEPGSARHWLNGQLHDPALDDGLVEVSPAAGTVRLDEAPLPGDRVLVGYEPA